MFHTNGSTTLPRGFRYHHEEPTTPEPPSAEEIQQPSPPRPRFKVRRRNASNLQAPTQHFLASVAAADVPIPTIELAPSIKDTEMSNGLSLNTSLLAPISYNHRGVSPPRTPMPGLEMEDASQRPDWSMTPAADDYFTRPTSSLSDASDFSDDDSFYSGSRISRPSDDGSCTSPESDIGDPFQFPKLRSKGKANLEDPFATITLNSKLRSKTRKDAPWTPAQSTHLWSTYMIYLQDPTVTPFRIGASSVPPEGVCHRVAREARRSWKGQKPAPAPLRRSSRLGSITSLHEKSGSNTPTAETPKVYAAWPHASSATRNHLRELCRNKGESSVSTHRHFQSRSPTPFTRFQLRPRTPDPRPSSFSTKDIALSLATSTSETMQRDGPLAQLAADNETPVARFFPPLEDFKPMSFGHSRDDSTSRRLGSPFMAARTYGPSSSKMLDPFAPRPSPPRTHSDTMRHLRSPLDFTKPYSLNGTQKRRAQNDLEEELSPDGAIVRPSILNEQLFGTPLNARRVRSRGFSLGDEALRHRVPGLFQRALIDPPQPKADTAVPQPLTQPSLLPAASFNPPRLGSPFSEAGPSNTFPRRLFHDGTATIRRSQFATMHQTRHSIESFDFGNGPSLQSRLQNLDMKLKQIRERESAARDQ